MRKRFVVSAAAWLEIVVGALFLTVPGVLCLLVFGAKPETIGLILGRFAGIALVALGIGGLASRDARSRNAALGLFAFNVGAATLFASVGIASAPHGILLWPVAILHTIIAAAFLPFVLARGQRSGGKLAASTPV